MLPLGSVFDQASVTVSLTGQDGKTVSQAAPGRVSTGTGPATATQLAGTVRGLGVNEAEYSLTTLDGRPLLYPREGTTFLAVGRQGNDLRVRLAPGLSALVTADQVALTRGLPLAAQPGPLVLDPSGAGELAWKWRLERATTCGCGCRSAERGCRLRWSRARGNST